MKKTCKWGLHDYKVMNNGDIKCAHCSCSPIDEGDACSSLGILFWFILTVLVLVLIFF